jgi:hypothetical protein
MSTLLAFVVLAQQAGNTSALFSHSAEVRVVGQPGEWARLPLPEEVLQQVDRDLGDCRLVDASGAYVPFVVQRERHALAGQRVALKLLSARRNEVVETEGAPHQYEETLVFALHSAPSSSTRLEFETNATEFARIALVETLTPQGEVLSRVETTFFRIPTLGERLELLLPPLGQAASQVRISLRGQGTGYVNLQAFAVSSPSTSRPTTLQWPISTAPLIQNQTSVWSFDKPPGVIPLRLALQTSTPWFNRWVSLGNARGEIARGRLFRQRGQVDFEKLELTLPALPGEQLEIRVENEDGPPLEEVQLVLVIEQPELVFAVPRALPLTLLFGGHRTRPARFDTPMAAGDLSDSQSPSTLGNIAPNRDFVSASPLAEYRKPGAPVPESAFAQRALVNGVRGEAVTRITFLGAHAARQSPDFRDLRLVDTQGRQWPYLLRAQEAKYEPQTEVVSKTGHTTFAFEAPGRVTQVTLTPAASAPFFSRRATLTFVSEGVQPVKLWEGTVVHQPRQLNAQALTMKGFTGSPGRYVVEFDDGGDAPVAGLTLQLAVVVPEMTALLEAGEYRVLWDAADQTAPHYDLSQAQALLEDLKVVTVQAEPPQKNPTYVAPSLLARSGGYSQWLFWVALLGAVFVLSALVLRIARA